MFLINTIHKLDAAERFFQGRKEGRNRGWRKTMEPAEKKPLIIPNHKDLEPGFMFVKSFSRAVS